ncbi:MAG: DNA polymerase III subunit chi [Pseudomonadota bacterium]
MTKVGFYIIDTAEADSRLRLALRLTDKAFCRGHRVYLNCESEAQARELDERLWTFRPSSFLPHSIAPLIPGEQEGELSEREAPISLGWTQEPGTHNDLLINLRGEIPQFFSRFKRVAELVNQEPQRLQALRDSYRIYRARGYPLEQHNLASV